MSPLVLIIYTEKSKRNILVFLREVIKGNNLWPRYTTGQSELTDMTNDSQLHCIQFLVGNNDDVYVIANIFCYICMNEKSMVYFALGKTYLYICLIFRAYEIYSFGLTL